MKIDKLIYKGEAFVKSVLFDCHSCGQCVLSKNGLICPMSCPKGLRNGPCGGTLGDVCEVDEQRKCVHCRIHKRVGRESLDRPFFLRPPNRTLERSSSYLNFFKGDDKESRIEPDHLHKWEIGLGDQKRTESPLEESLRSQSKTLTCEIRSPRNPGDKRFLKEAEILQDYYDAFNVTAFLNGKPSMPSTDTAIALKQAGFEPIVQAASRDFTRTSFVSELLRCSDAGINNILCLTGDYYHGAPGIKQVFDYDSSTMLYEAAYLGEKGKILFTGDEVPGFSARFLGAAINPYTRPMNVPIRRLKQKAYGGADFIQSQLIFETEPIKEFMELFVSEGLKDKLYFLAGVPLVTSKAVLKLIPAIPGVHISPDTLKRLESADDLKGEGVKLTMEIIDQLWDMDGISGFHMMLFGSGTKELKIISDYIRDKEK